MKLFNGNFYVYFKWLTMECKTYRFTFLEIIIHIFYNYKCTKNKRREIVGITKIYIAYIVLKNVY